MSEGVFNVGAAVAKLELNTGGFTKGFLQAESLMQTFPSLVTSFMAHPLLALADVFKRVTSAMTGWIGAITEMDDAADELAQSVGVDVEFLSSLGKVAEMNGGSMEQAADAIRFLGKNMADAAQGNRDTQTSFARLGVSIGDATGGLRPIEDVLLDVGEALRQLPDGATRTQAAMDLLGRGGTGMIPTFMQGKSALRAMMDETKGLNAITTGESAALSDRWTRAIGKIGWAWEGLKRAFTVAVMPELLPILEKFVAWLIEHFEDLKKTVVEVGKVVVQVVKAMAAAFEYLEDKVSWMREGESGLSGLLSMYGRTFVNNSPVGLGYQAITGEKIFASHGTQSSPTVNQTFNMTVDGTGDIKSAVRRFEQLLEDSKRQAEGALSRQAVLSGL